MSRKGQPFPGMRRLHQIARRSQAVLSQYQAHGPLIYDQFQNRWINPLDDLQAHGLAWELLRLQRGPRLQQVDQPRQVLYVREGDADYLESRGRRYLLGLDGVELLEAVLEILEAER